jgi:hypothetical protein
MFLIGIITTFLKICFSGSAKTVYNNHPWISKVIFLLTVGLVEVGKFINSKLAFKVVVVVGKWSLIRGGGH